MRATTATSFSGPDGSGIVDLPEAVAASGDDVVVKVRAAAHNFLDRLITRGKYQFKPVLPFSPAGEIAGDAFAARDPVTAFVMVNCAMLRCCDLVRAIRRPDRLAAKGNQIIEIA